MAQPMECIFCGRPRQLNGDQWELFYLVEISGPYLTQFDEDTTGARSKNKKNMWGCRDCVNVIQDLEYWSRYDEGTNFRPYHVMNDQQRNTVLALGVSRHPRRSTDHDVARKYPPVYRNTRVKQQRAVNE
jgi:hypothetical protein